MPVSAISTPISNFWAMPRAEAGRIAMRFFRQRPEVWMKAGSSPVSEADYAVDRFLRETLLAARPHYGWLSEETADSGSRLSARRTFVVDPIDGTRGFLEGRDIWCVSAAVVENGRPLAGVLEVPARQETYTALPGRGAFKNGARIMVRPSNGQPSIARAEAVDRRDAAALARTPGAPCLHPVTCLPDRHDRRRKP